MNTLCKSEVILFGFTMSFLHQLLVCFAQFVKFTGKRGQILGTERKHYKETIRQSATTLIPICGITAVVNRCQLTQFLEGKPFNLLTLLWTDYGEFVGVLDTTPLLLFAFDKILKKF